MRSEFHLFVEFDNVTNSGNGIIAPSWGKDFEAILRD
jgi:hypothetical protein